VGSRGRGVQRVQRVWSGVTAPRMTGWRPMRRCLRPRCARWRKAMRCAPLRAASQWIRTRSVPGGIGVACHCRTVRLSCWHDWHGSACHLDELWSVVHTQEAPLPGAQLECETSGDAGVWSAFAPVWRVALACGIGTREQAGADGRLARGAHGPDAAMPWFTSDPWPAYRHALLPPYGAWDHPPRQGHRGASPTPRRRPPSRLRDAQVVNRRKGGRMGDGSTRVGCGPPEAVAASVAHAPVSWTVNPSVVARGNLPQRQSKRR